MEKTSTSDRISNEKKFYVHVTEVAKDKCERNLEYRIRGVKGKNPPRWITSRGTFFHELMDEYVSDQKELTTEHVAEVVLKTMGVDENNTSNFQQEDVITTVAKAKCEMDAIDPVITAPNIDIVSEENFTVDLTELADGRKVILTGTPDLVIIDDQGHGSIYDYKTGKRHMKAHDEQLRLYAYYLQKLNKVKQVDYAELHYLGNFPQHKAHEVSMENLDTCEEKVDEFVKKIVEISEWLLIDDTHPVTQCKESYGCMFCSFFGDPCKGI